MIELAPDHKLGLPVANPILLGAGAIGYGEATPKGLDLAQVGAAVVGPILGSSRGGSQPPRVTHHPGGCVLDVGLQNRGVNSTIQQFARLWPTLGCPVIAQLADDHPATLVKVIARLAQVDGLHGFELLLPPMLETSRAAALVRAAERETDLPIWAKLPLDRAAALAPAVCDAGAVGVVVGQPPAAAGSRVVNGSPHVVRGQLYGPAAFALMLPALLDVAALHLPAALIAAGGVHTADQVRQALAAGAQAVQVDSAVWVEPGLPSRLIADLI